MDADNVTAAPVPLRACMRIVALLPDDGGDRRLIRALHRARGVDRVHSVAVRAVAALREAKTRANRLPEPTLARKVTAIVEEVEADAVFDFIVETANIGRPGGGMVLMDRLLGATPFDLPEGVPEEQS